MKIGIIGVGKISSAITEAICTSEIVDYEIHLSPRNKEKSLELSEKFDEVHRQKSNQAVVDESDLVFIALRPGVYKSALSELKFTKDQSIVSLIPFLGITELKELVSPAENLSRAIPLPTIVNHVCPVPIFNPSEKVLELFNILAQPLIVNTEKELHTIWTLTCLISPYYDLMSTLSEWSVNNSVDKSLADKYVADMFNSLAFAASNSNNPDFDSLSNHAATPGGLNEKAAAEISDGGAHSAYTDAANGVLRMFGER